MEKAARERRVAVLPEWLTEGSRVWYWRETLCGDDLCPDMVTSICPINKGKTWNDPTVMTCARRHPELECTEIWSAAAYFTPRGIEWCINEGVAVPDEELRRIFFPTREAAQKHRPEVILYG